MSIQFVKPKNVHEILQKIEQKVRHYRKSQQAHLIVKACLFPKFEGKKINKRMHTAVVGPLKDAGFSCYWHPSFSWTELTIQYEGSDSKITLNLGYNNSPILTLTEDFFIKQNSGYNNPGNIIERMVAGKEKLLDFTNRWNGALHTLQQLNKEAEAFGYQYDFDINTRD
jgi:hypothetical protein